MIGDTTTDIEAGRRAGIRTVLLRTGYAGTDSKHAVRPDYICPDLPDAVDWILNGHAEMTRLMASIALTAESLSRLVLIGGLARAGKSFAAQVLKEVLQSFGRKAHVVSLDGWLKPKNQRSEGTGVCDRFNLKSASEMIQRVALSRSRETLKEGIYDRISGTVGLLEIEHSIGPEDILIVEGVPALLMDELNSLANTIKVYVDIEPSSRTARLSKDYAWRDQPTDRYETALAMRELDETPTVMGSRSFADFIVASSGTRKNNDRK
jgi:uridine kinase